MLWFLLGLRVIEIACIVGLVVVNFQYRKLTREATALAVEAGQQATRQAKMVAAMREVCEQAGIHILIDERPNGFRITANGSVTDHTPETTH